MTTTQTLGDQQTPSQPQSNHRSSTSPARALSFWEGVRLVAKREVLMQARSRAFQVSFILTLVFVAGGIVAMNLFGGMFAGSTPTVAATTQTQQQAQDAGLDVLVVGTVPEAVAAVEAGDVDSAVLPASALGELTAYNDDATVATDPGASDIIVVGNDAPSSDVMQALTVAPEGFSLIAPTAAPWLAYLLTVAFGILFFMSALTYCSTIAQSVVEEKQTRIIEILLATVSPRTIMAGKVLGNSLLALVQVTAIAIVAIGTLAATGQTFVLGFLGPAVLWFAALFVVGFVLLAALYAGVAATVSRQEDVASATSPLMFLIMIPYFGAFMAANNPTLMTVMSYVPFSAPIAMPVRVFTADAAWWEPILSLVILIITAAAAIWIGSKIYENAVLRMGGRVKIMDALKG